MSQLMKVTPGNVGMFSSKIPTVSQQARPQSNISYSMSQKTRVDKNAGDIKKLVKRVAAMEKVIVNLKKQVKKLKAPKKRRTRKGRKYTSDRRLSANRGWANRPGFGGSTRRERGRIKSKYNAEGVMYDVGNILPIFMLFAVTGFIGYLIFYAKKRRE